MNKRHSMIFVKGLRVDASIGVHPHEHETTQPIFIDVQLALGDTPPPVEDRLGETIDYEAVAEQAKRLARQGHVQLVETLAEKLADWCLQDARVRAVTVRIEKPNALAAADAAGVEITRLGDEKKSR
jgi:7,8-dihydroneopterin aldolase/epimerase/oxygenase